MKPLGLVVVFAGYTLAYFGWCSVRGPGVGLIDLVVPGRPVVIPGSSASSSSSSAPATHALPPGTLGPKGPVGPTRKPPPVHHVPGGGNRG
jgi:hypothetical protein